MEVEEENCSLKRNVFNWDLKMETEGQSRRDCGRAFQSLGAVALKDQPPKVDTLVHGTGRRLEVEDVRDGGGE